MWRRRLAILVVAVVCFNLYFISTAQFQTNRAVVSGSSTTRFPVLHVDPQHVTASVGESFTISAMVFNLTDNIWEYPGHPEWGTFSLGNLYGFGIEFSWDPTVLEYVSHTVTLPVDAVNPYTGEGPFPDGVLHSPVYEVKDIVKPSVGTYELKYSSYGTAEPFNNPLEDNSFFNMTFRVLKEGASILGFGLVNLASSSLPAKPIELEIEDGIFSVSEPGERDIKVGSVEVSQWRATQGVEVSVNATISNLGLVSENFTAVVYYNQTSIDWGDPMVTGNWEKIGERDETELEPAESRLLSFEWDTSGVLDSLGVTEAYFYTMVNVSQVPDEVNVENNFNWTRIWVTLEEIHDVAITKIQILPFGSPLIVNETATIQTTVLNNGTVPETFDVNLYYVAPDGGEVPLETWNIEDLLGSRRLSRTWDTTGQPLGVYTLVANASIVEDEETVENNVMEQHARIVGAPILEVTVSPADFVRFSEENEWYEWKGSLDETITLNAEGSSHQDPCIITDYVWTISLEGELKDTQNTTIAEYTFDEEGSWLIELKTTDNYDLTYTEDRAQTKHYRHLIALTVEERAEELEGVPDIVVYAAVIIVVVVVGLIIAVYFLKIRKS